MKRLIAKLVLDLAAKVIDDTVPTARLQAFLQRMDRVAPALLPEPLAEAFLAARSGRRDWEGNLAASAAGAIVAQGRVRTNTLQGLAEAPASDGAKVVAERLMRWIEVKRKDSIPTFGIPGDAESAWRDYLWAAILFSRLSQSTRDIRYVNTALKMNDWAFPALHRREQDTVGLLLALSIAEQENAMRLWEAA